MVPCRVITRLLSQLSKQIIFFYQIYYNAFVEMFIDAMYGFEVQD